MQENTFAKMETALIGRRALVCGSTQGIGRATALTLAGLGAEVVLLARSEAKLKEVLGTLPNNNGQSHSYMEADLSNTHALAQKIQGLQVDILINNTGGPPPGAAHLAEVEAFEQAFRQHLLAFQTLVKALVPGMKERLHGRIINVISTSVKQPLPNLGVSNTIRGAVANWSKTLANELGPFGITVNNVLPGATDTGRLRTIIGNKATASAMPQEEVADEMMKEIPLRRFAQPAEIANAIAFLAGPSASYINGINLPVDGGRTGSL